MLQVEVVQGKHREKEARFCGHVVRIDCPCFSEYSISHVPNKC